VVGALLSLVAQERTAVVAGDGGALAAGAWVIVVAPLVAAFAIVWFGKRMRWGGAELAIGAIGLVLGYASLLLIRHHQDGIVSEHQVQIARVGRFDLEWGWVTDGLSIMMFFVIGLVSLACFVYAAGYLKGEARYTWFFAAFSLFAGAMLLLVSAPNLVQLLVGWELVGVASYLLIGHYWEQQENSSAGIKAFIVNRVGDVGLVIGIAVLAWTVGSFRISDILAAAVDKDPALAKVAVAAGILLFIGAMGKSAQFPLHVWLPDAMAGPTPVSALMHAATMVTAGVYLLARMFPLYRELAQDASDVVLVIGVITLLIAGLLALVQRDLKRVLAYSTVSQLGYMTAAMGAGAYTAGLFHLFTHAFFKSLLFLGAGSAIHAVHSNDLHQMGGLRKFMPTTFRTFVVGSLALSGIPVFAGFFSKDEILAAFNAEQLRVALAVGLLAAFITAFYMTRAVLLAFFGTYRSHGHPQESPRILTNPLLLLAGLATVVGFLNIPGVTSTFADWVGTRRFSPLDHHAEGFDWPVVLAGVGAGLAGIICGYWLYARDAATQADRDRFRIPLLWPLLERKYYLDDLYAAGIVNPIKGPIARGVEWVNGYVIDGVVNATGMLTQRLGDLVYRRLDQGGIDRGINGISVGTGLLGGVLRFLQGGKVQQYATGLFAGVLVLVTSVLVFR